MAFQAGDRVRITVDRDFVPDHVPKGTLGTVTQPVPAGNACWAKFDTMNRDVLVPNSILAAAP